MRSLTVKLSLAFLLVGVIGALLVALLIGQRTRSEFSRFLSERDATTLVDPLGTFYTTNGNWNGVDELLTHTMPFSTFSRSITLAAANSVAVFGRGGYTSGQIPAAIIGQGTPIMVKGQAVGYVLIATPGERPPTGSGRPLPDQQFLERVTTAAAISAAIAALIALMLGVLLARTLTRPLLELTAATQAMARGDLDQRVNVHSRDEIGALATSFNQMSADLARGSQLRKQMSADLAHDLRTPLSILRGYTEGLQDGRLHGSPMIYTIMHSEVEHLQRLVEDLRVLSLADAGELSLNRRAVDLAALLERTGLAYIVPAEAQGVALRVDAPEGLPSIVVDTDRMTQVLNNLVSNALRYTSQGEIVLSASADTQHVRLSVCDTGSGIAAADVPFIFDRFYRADKARQRTDSSEGGLGLAIVKAIVESHGSTIAVASQLDQGTTFTISVPVAALSNEVGAHALAARAHAAVKAHDI